jgi:hypothetical protein
MRLLFTVSCISLLLAGCEMPTPQFTSADPQQITASVAHWGEIAASTAKQLHAAAPAVQEVYLASSTNGGFDQGFKDLLTTELLKQGISVTSNPNELYEIAVDVDVVKHHNYTQVPLIPGAIIGSVNALLVPVPHQTRTEIVVATTIERNDGAAGFMTIASSSGTFYIERSDAGEYGEGASSETLHVVGS